MGSSFFNLPNEISTITKSIRPVNLILWTHRVIMTLGYSPPLYVPAKTAVTPRCYSPLDHFLSCQMGERFSHSSEHQI